jgi:hypothetical protein
VVVTGDLQLLSGQVVVALPDLQADTVDATVGPKVDAEVGLGDAVGRDSDLGAVSVVDELLEDVVGRCRLETVAASWKGK